MKKLLVAVLLLAPSSLYATVFGVNGWCQKGGQGVVTQGLKSSGTYTLPSGSLISSTGVQASYPSCRVTVYDTGTITKPTIYSTAGMGALGNPFTANADGSWLLFAASGCYDIVTDQGSMPAAHTDTDVCVGGGGVPGGGTVTSANPATDAGTFNPLFTYGFASQTTTPTLSFTLLAAGAHTVFGNGSGASAFPSYFTLGTGDLPFTYSGDTTKLATVSATFTGTGAPVYRDANGNLSTSGTPAGVTSWNTRTGDVVPASGDYGVADVTGAAPLDSPAFTNTPTAPTAAPGTSTTQLATTAFVATSFAPKANPTFTGVPLAPTAAVDTNTTQIATTAFVLAQASDTNPLINGTAAPGTSSRWARYDHVHPTDTTRAAVDNPTFTTAITTPLVKTTTNCTAVGSAANPSLVACSAAPSGVFSCATAASTGTCVVSTTAATTNSNIVVTPTASAGTRLGVTCNTTADSPTGPRVAAISNGVSFTINLGAVSGNPTCYSYLIVN